MDILRVVSKVSSICFLQPSFFWRPGFMVSLFLLAAILPARAQTDGDFAYKANAATITITKYLGPGGDVVIPDYIQGKPVWTIGTNAFRDCTSLMSVTLPSQVRNILDSAFSGCTGLTSITIPNNVSRIENASFGSCSNLTSVYFNGNAPVFPYSSRPFSNSDLVTLYFYPNKTGWSATYAGRPAVLRIDPNANDYEYWGGPMAVRIRHYKGANNVVTIPNVINGITVIGVDDEAFFMHPLLKSVTIPSGVTNIGARAFAGCCGLTNLSMSDTVVGIGAEAFSGCQSLKEIAIPSRVKSIPESAFEYCRGMENVVIPDSVTNIGIWAFIGCRGLTNITIPESVIAISSAAFEGCSGLTSITIPSNVPSIRNSTFYQCNGLTNVMIPNSVTNIEAFAFYGCSSLINISIPSSVTSIEPYAFYGCSSLVNISIPSNVTSIEAYAFYGCGSLVNIFIPSSVTNIDAYAFTGCSSLTALVIPDGVTSIENYTFSGCSSMTSITIPNSVTNIGNGAFRDNTQLTNIIIPDSVVSVGAAAFSGCSSLTNITLSRYITVIGAQAFAHCSSLREITVDPENAAYSSRDGVLFNKDQTLLLQCPAGMVGSYAMPSSIIDMNYSAFAGCASLTNITPSINITNILFYDCTGLRNIVIPDNVTCLGQMAFMECGELSNIFIPQSVTNIYGNAFLGCTNLTDITVDPLNPVYASRDGVLFDKSLQTLVSYPGGKEGGYSVPDDVTNIGSSAFARVQGLTAVSISRGVINIGSGAFDGCGGLTAINVDASNPIFASVDGVLFDKSLKTLLTYPSGRMGHYSIPDSVTNIPGRAFSGCAQLTSVTMPETVIGMGNGVFLDCTSLTNVILPGSITNIGYDAFRNCTALTRVTIPKNVVSFEMCCFENCYNLRGVYFEGNTPKHIDPEVFINDPDVTVYYRLGTTGWRNTLVGKPTALWPYQDWAQTVGLADKYPNDCNETDDADQDGMTNLAEMQAGTDPIIPNSKLTFETTPRPDDLADADKTAIDADQHALYFQTVPGRNYEIQSANSLTGAWLTKTYITATTTQKRVVFAKPAAQEFYRVAITQ
jgi:hypothetical protein